MIKTPKTFATPDVSKNPKIGYISNYKQKNPVWQIGILDIEGKWGYKAFNQNIGFEVSDELLAYLVEHDLNKLSDGLDRLKAKSNLTLHGLFSYISTLDSEDCPNEVLKLIVRDIKHQFFLTKLYPKLKEYEKLTWDEIEKQQYGSEGKTKNHPIAKKALIKEAQDRLKELKQDDVDEVYSLRLEGKLRIFGIREDNCLKIIWVDTNHEVCESHKKHT